MNRFATVAALAFLAGCGLSESKFETESQKAGCEYLVECLEAYADVDACLADIETPDTTDCEYDSKAAKECLDGLQALECTDTSYPSVCDDVYTCTDTGDTSDT